MKRGIVALALVLSVPAASASAGDALSFEKNWLTPNISTLGVGVEGGYRWNDYWGGRIGINGLAFNYTYNDKDADLVNRATLMSAGVTADYYPYAGDWRVSA